MSSKLNEHKFDDKVSLNKEMAAAETPLYRRQNQN